MNFGFEYAYRVKSYPETKYLYLSKVLLKIEKKKNDFLKLQRSKVMVPFLFSFSNVFSMLSLLKQTLKPKYNESLGLAIINESEIQKYFIK